MALVALLVVVLGGVYLLREATMSTHYETGADSRLVVVVQASSNRAEPGTTLLELAEAQVSTCVLQVASERVGEVEPVLGADDRFTVTLQPSLDSTDRKQYEGCVEDWSVDHLRLHVVSMTDRVVAR
ncbi:MAG TPA: hypothetical protein VGO60_16565 [Iamia sp.]|jgi:hypothetical protein|nr:hypothetical protein [Iamia sp.]